MTELHDEPSLVDQVLADPRGRIEFALAEYSMRLEELFHAVFAARPDVDLSEIARTLGVDVERIERLLEGEDELAPAAFVRYASALGYRVVTNAVPDRDSIPELPDASQQWGGAYVDRFEQRFVSMHGVETAPIMRFRLAVDSVPLEQPRYVRTIDSKTGAEIESEEVPVGADVTLELEVV